MASEQASPAALAIHQGLKAGGADFAVYLPDSVLSGVERLLEDDGDVRTIACAREDEGVAIAMGAWLAGLLPVALMEGSGVGYAALILARAKWQRTGLLLICSHGRVLGERFDYHGATSLVAEGVLRGLDIPYLVMDDPARMAATVEQALVTVRGHKAVVGLVVPGHLTA